MSDPRDDDLLSALAVSIAAMSDGRDILATAAEHVVRAVADWCIADLLSDPDLITRAAALGRHGELDVPAEFGRADARRSSAGDGGLLAALSTAAQPMLRFDLQQLQSLADSDDPRARGQAQMTLSLGAIDLLVIGARTRTQILGVLAIARTTESFSPPDVALLLGFAAVVGLALDNARLLGNQRSVSAAMQTSLLPPLPSYAGVRLAARYRPAMTGLDVGGDWYDAFPLPSGGLALVIGDVTGHDAEAAAQMAELRNLLRAIACHRGDSPAEILAALEQTTSRLHVDASATCLLAILDPPDNGVRLLRWSSAGHLPPLLVREGEARFLDTAADLMLGVDAGSVRTEHQTTVLPGDLIVLYSDGLVEDRRSHLDERLSLLAGAAVAAPDGAPDYLVDWLLQEMIGDGTDDIAVLVARVDPEPG